MMNLPGLGIVRGMALTLLRFFQPKATVRYPEVPADNSVYYRGRLQLLYDEYGTLKCETCFQCAQACPIECIDMGGVDTRGRYQIHWGPPETYAERRDESALRRAGRTVPDPAFTPFATVDTAAVDEILDRHDHDPRRMLAILEETQAAYGHLPVAALKRISFATGAWYAMIYGTASYYRHFRFEQPVRAVEVCRCTSCTLDGGGRILAALERELGTRIGEPVPDGSIRVAALDGHVPGARSPLVIIDGEPQPEVSPENATAWARSLSGRAQA